MLARACGREGGVVAVEEYAPCAALARKIVGGDGIDVRCARSDEVACETENERFDVMCAELLDSELVGEGWLKTAREARRRLTRGRGATIPRRGRTHARLVRCEKAAKYYGAIGDAASAGGVPVALQKRAEAACAFLLCLAALATKAHPTKWASRDGASPAGVTACGARRTIRGLSPIEPVLTMPASICIPAKSSIKVAALAGDS